MVTLFSRYENGCSRMIGSFKDGDDGALAVFYRDGKRGAEIPATICGALERKLDILEMATTERSLFAPPSNNYERLTGNLEGWSSIRVNIQWRLIFQWRDGIALNVYLDPHTYR